MGAEMGVVKKGDDPPNEKDVGNLRVSEPRPPPLRPKPTGDGGLSAISPSSPPVRIQCGGFMLGMSSTV